MEEPQPTMNVEWGEKERKQKQNEKCRRNSQPEKREFFTPISCIYNHAFGRVPELELSRRATTVTRTKKLNRRQLRKFTE